MSRIAEAWDRLAHRNIEMAGRLLPEYPDGSFFHLYHAFECALSSALLHSKPSESLPEGHRDRFFAYIDFIGAGPLRDELASLWPRIDRRTEALYVGHKAGQVREPHSQFKAGVVKRLLEEVSSVVSQLPHA